MLIKKIFMLLNQGWVILFAVFLLTDNICYLLRESISRFDIWLYLSSLLLSLIFFYTLETLKRILPAIVSNSLFLFISFFLAFLIIASVYVFLEFGDFVTPSKLQFALNQPEYFAAFTKDYLLNWNILFLLGIWTLFFYLQVFYKRIKKKQSLWMSSAILILCVISYLVIINQVVWHSNAKRMDIVTSFFTSLKKLNKPFSSGLYESRRLKIEKFKLNDNINVILIINESFGKKAFNLTDTKTPMPFLKEWMTREHDRFFFFDNAFTNSSATDVSVPSILTGVAPYETSKKLHSMPFLWDWAKAAGMSTVLVSAQFYSWAYFHVFFKPYPDIFLTADQIQREGINDGIDELLGIRKFCETLDRMRGEQGFLAIYNSNALHSPFQQKSKYLSVIPDFGSRYKNAANILDHSFEYFYNYCQSKNLLENTVLIITGDHGDSDSLLHVTHRLFSFYDEIQNIPFIIYLPASLSQKHPEWISGLKANKDKIIANIDILPTIVDILGVPINDNNKKIFKNYSGYSLINPIPDDRFSISVNTNEIRQWEREGFGIFFKERRFVYSDIERAGYYDIDKDKYQKNNLWKKMTSAERNRILHIIDSNFNLKRMFVNE